MTLDQDLADTVGALLLGVPEEGGLVYVGRVGTGFTLRQLAAALELLAPLRASESPFLAVAGRDAVDAHWVRPVLVGEVEFSEWTAAGRLRHPSWRGWRTDKGPADVRVEPRPGDVESSGPDSSGPDAAGSAG